MDHSQSSRQYSRMADATEQIQVISKPGSLKEAEGLFYNNEINGIILIPSNFEKNLLNGKQTNITVYCDASYFMLYKQLYSSSAYTVGTFNAGVEIKRLLSENKSLEQAKDLQEPLKVSTYNLYNAAGGYGSFVMPGIILIIIQQTLLVGIGMIGGTTREKKKSLKHTHLVLQKWGNAKLITGKSLAYTSIYLVTSIFAIGLLPKWFSFPYNFNFTSLLLLTTFLLSTSFLGLTISLLFKQRVHSMLFMVFLSPLAVFLSGISWPVEAIPKVLYWIGYIFPSTIIVPAWLRLQICDVGFASIASEYIFAFIQMIAYFILACLSYRYALKRFGTKIGSNFYLE
jgi:ABC-2 type transport system permease protein